LNGIFFFFFFFFFVKQTKRLSKRQFICNGVWRLVVEEIDQSVPIKSFKTIISSYTPSIFSSIKYNFLTNYTDKIAKV